MARVVRIILALLLACAADLGIAAEPDPDSPRLLVHLLDYLAKDYGGAVEDGRVINELEYREQLEFAQEAAALAGRLSATKDQSSVVSGVDALNDLVTHKAPSAEVSALALRVKAQVIQAAHLAQAPTHWPDLERGRVLYRQNCVACHGEHGGGDGPAALTLKPRPANFLAPETGADISPFRAFNTIRVGIPGTTMVPWPTLADEDVWALAFYVTSLHVDAASPRAAVSLTDLEHAATLTDRELLASLPADAAGKAAKIAGMRLQSGDTLATTVAIAGPASAGTLALAQRYLTQAQDLFALGEYDGARRAALLAYLEGIEPIEPQLRASDAAFVTELESRMAAVRSAIEAQVSNADLKAQIDAARVLINDAQTKLSQPSGGPWVTFLLTVGILLREGFEAVLILIALLAVIRASSAPDAAKWVHAGWGTALGVGIAAWFFSGWVMAISGAQREMLEGVTALIAVAVLLYVGFWLHSWTEISRWTQFINVQMKSMLSGRNLWGLAAIAFMAVFREAFETVLFMRALTLEGGPAGMNAMLLGAVLSIGGLAALSWLLLKYSARLPIRNIFTVSSTLMVILAVILTGKGMHALQETGAVSVASTPWRWSTEVLGVYASWQPLLAQLVIAVIIAGLWRLGSRPATQPR